MEAAYVIWQYGTYRSHLVAAPRRYVFVLNKDQEWMSTWRVVLLNYYLLRYLYLFHLICWKQLNKKPSYCWESRSYCVPPSFNYKCSKRELKVKTRNIAIKCFNLFARWYQRLWCKRWGAWRIGYDSCKGLKIVKSCSYEGTSYSFAQSLLMREVSCSHNAQCHRQRDRRHYYANSRLYCACLSIINMA